MDELLASLRVAAQQYATHEKRKITTNAEIEALNRRLEALHAENTDAESSFLAAESTFGTYVRQILDEARRGVN